MTWPCATRAMPKSTTLGSVRPTMKMLAGLMSQWITPLAVRIGQRVGHASHDLRGLHDVGPPAVGQQLAQVAPAQSLHRDVNALFRQASVVHRHDVRVVQAGGGPRFVEEQCIERGAVAFGRAEVQGLDRDRARQDRVIGRIDGAQATFTQALLQRIAADVANRQALRRGCVGRGIGGASVRGGGRGLRLLRIQVHRVGFAGWGAPVGLLTPIIRCFHDPASLGAGPECLATKSVG